MTHAARSAWRLLVTEPLDGATNMALDEALLRSRLAGQAPPTVRFFGWAPPAVSLGYGQPLDGLDLAACGRLGLGLVRRPTGGSAILHEAPSFGAPARRGAEGLVTIRRIYSAAINR